ncbi:MAG: hypothetical protein IKT43_02520 [Clostridia bacterium]|nr:hypothetical protein [Clostridia bacterium]
MAQSRKAQMPTESFCPPAKRGKGQGSAGANEELLPAHKAWQRAGKGKRAEKRQGTRLGGKTGKFRQTPPGCCVLKFIPAYPPMAPRLSCKDKICRKSTQKRPRAAQKMLQFKKRYAIFYITTKD